MEGSMKPVSSFANDTVGEISHIGYMSVTRVALMVE